MINSVLSRRFSTASVRHKRISCLNEFAGLMYRCGFPAAGAAEADRLRRAGLAWADSLLKILAATPMMHQRILLHVLVSFAPGTQSVFGLQPGRNPEGPPRPSSDLSSDQGTNSLSTIWCLVCVAFTAASSSLPHSSLLHGVMAALPRSYHACLSLSVDSCSSAM